MKMNTEKLTPEEWQMFENYLLGLDQPGVDRFKQQMKDNAHQMYPDLQKQQEPVE